MYGTTTPPAATDAATTHPSTATDGTTTYPPAATDSTTTHPPAATDGTTTPTTSLAKRANLLHAVWSSCCSGVAAINGTSGVRRSHHPKCRFPVSAGRPPVGLSRYRGSSASCFASNTSRLSSIPDGLCPATVSDANREWSRVPASDTATGIAQHGTTGFSGSTREVER